MVALAMQHLANLFGLKPRIRREWRWLVCRLRVVYYVPAIHTGKLTCLCSLLKLFGVATHEGAILNFCSIAGHVVVVRKAAHQQQTLQQMQ